MHHVIKTNVTHFVMNSMQQVRAVAPVDAKKGAINTKNLVVALMLAHMFSSAIIVDAAVQAVRIISRSILLMLVIKQQSMQGSMHFHIKKNLTLKRTK